MSQIKIIYNFIVLLDLLFHGSDGSLTINNKIHQFLAKSEILEMTEGLIKILIKGK